MARPKKYTIARAINDFIGVVFVVAGLYFGLNADSETQAELLLIVWGDKKFSILVFLIFVGIVQVITPRAKALVDLWAYWKDNKDGKQ